MNKGEICFTGTSAEHGLSGQLKDQIDAACKGIWSGDVKITGGNGEKSGGKK